MDGNHVYYVDQKPRIFDARIYEGAGTSGHPLYDLWDHMSGPHTGRESLYPRLEYCFGGRHAFWRRQHPRNRGFRHHNGTTADTTRTFASSYFAIDITDPLNPVLLWERSYNGLGFTTSFPAVLKVEDRVITTGTPDTVDRPGATLVPALWLRAH